MAVRLVVLAALAAVSCQGGAEVDTRTDTDALESPTSTIHDGRPAPVISGGREPPRPSIKGPIWASHCSATASRTLP